MNGVKIEPIQISELALRELKVRYQGRTKVMGVETFYFHDLQTNEHIRVQDVERLDLAVELHRATFYKQKEAE
jgi:hypothetical protein